MNTKLESELITKLILHTIEYTQRNLKSEKATLIAQTVHHVISTLLEAVALQNSKFKCIELLKVGSSHEGTKIVQPDEFDFLAVIEELSRPGAIVVNTSPHPGLAEIRLVDKELKQRWENSGETCVLNNFLDQKNGNPKSCFGATILNILAEEAEKQTLEYSVMPGIAIFNFDGLKMPSCTEMSINLRSVLITAPNIQFGFEVGELSISVDLVPAIRYYNVGDCFNAKDCFSDDLATVVLERDTILLVNQIPGKNIYSNQRHVFRITFTETEVEYITNMNRHHKSLYIFLKSFCESYKKATKQIGKRGIPSLKSSYVIKLICINHNEKCPNLQRLDLCFYLIILDMFRCSELDSLRSPFNRNVDILEPSSGSFEQLPRLVDVLLDIFTEHLPADIPEDFDPISYFEKLSVELHYANSNSKEMIKKKFARLRSRLEHEGINVSHYEDKSADSKL